MVASSLKIDSVNDQTWDHFVKEAWRYSLPEVSLTNVKTEAVYAENVTVETTIGGSSPSTWLLKTGGRVHGKLKVMNLTVDGNVNVGDNLVNGVNLGEVVDATSPTSTIADAKSFRSINVENFVNVSTIKDVSQLFGSIFRK